MQPKTDRLKLDQQLCFQLYLASKTLTQIYQPLLEPLDLTYPQYLVLLVLWERDGLSIKELGGKLHLDSGTLSPLLKRMITKEFISKERDAADERSVVVKLSSKGRAIKSKALCIPSEMMEQLSLNANEARTLFSVLRSLNEKLGSTL